MVKPNDIILIELDRGDGSGLYPVMIGLVDRVARSRTHTSQGQPVNRISIHGMDMGKMLVRHNIGWDLARLDLNDGDPMARRFQNENINWQMSGTPDQNVKQVIENLFYPQVGSWVRDYIFHALDSSDPWTCLNFTINEANGSAWATMKQVANEPWNMLFADTQEDGKFWVLLRRRPFMVGAKRAKLTPDVRLIDVGPEEIIEENLGVGDADLINYASFENYANLFGADNLAYVFYKFAQWDEELVKDYGFRPFRPQTPYLPFLEDRHAPITPDTQGAIDERTTALWDWHRRAHEYESGSISVHGDPRARIAMGVYMPDTGMEYFIEEVRHQYIWGDRATTFKTTLGLTRGQPHGPRSDDNQGETQEQSDE